MQKLSELFPEVRKKKIGREENRIWRNSLRKIRICKVLRMMGMMMKYC